MVLLREELVVGGVQVFHVVSVGDNDLGTVRPQHAKARRDFLTKSFLHQVKQMRPIWSLTDPFRELKSVPNEGLWDGGPECDTST